MAPRPTILGRGVGRPFAANGVATLARREELPRKTRWRAAARPRARTSTCSALMVLIAPSARPLEPTSRRRPWRLGAPHSVPSSVAVLRPRPRSACLSSTSRGRASTAFMACRAPTTPSRGHEIIAACGRACGARARARIQASSVERLGEAARPEYGHSTLTACGSCCRLALGFCDSVGLPRVNNGIDLQCATAWAAAARRGSEAGGGGNRLGVGAPWRNSAAATRSTALRLLAEPHRPVRRVSCQLLRARHLAHGGGSGSMGWGTARDKMSLPRLRRHTPFEQLSEHRRSEWPDARSSATRSRSQLDERLPPFVHGRRRGVDIRCLHAAGSRRRRPHPPTPRRGSRRRPVASALGAARPARARPAAHARVARASTAARRAGRRARRGRRRSRAARPRIGAASAVCGADAASASLPSRRASVGRARSADATSTAAASRRAAVAAPRRARARPEAGESRRRRPLGRALRAPARRAARRASSTAAT